MPFVWLVVDDTPSDMGGGSVLSAYANPKAAKAERKALHQLNEFTNQYVEVQRFVLRNTSEHVPVKKRGRQ